MRLIDADALKEEWIKDTGRAFPADYFIFTIDRSPTIDAVPVVRGEWVVREYQSSLFGVDRDWACSECEEVINLGDDELHPLHDAGLNFCPNCGCDMRGERDGEK